MDFCHVIVPTYPAAKVSDVPEPEHNLEAKLLMDDAFGGSITDICKILEVAEGQVPFNVLATIL